MKIKEVGKNSFSTDLSLSSDSPWFDGHFPQKPILPALAIIYIVLNLVRLSTKKPNLHLKTIPKSRIRSLVLPGQHIEVRCEITHESEKNSLYSVKFEINRQGERVGDGRMEVG